MLCCLFQQIDLGNLIFKIYNGKEKIQESILRSNWSEKHFMAIV